MNKYKEIKNVLIVTLLLNASVAIIKLIFGVLFNISILLADGLHSLSDSLNNIVGLVVINFSKKRNDKKHPYGYEKYETIATLIIGFMIAIMGYETLTMGIKKLVTSETVEKAPFILYFFIILTIVINIVTVLYEGRKSRKLKSEFLIADSNETKGDILISLGVIAGVFFNFTYPHLRLEGIFTIIISLFIFKNAYSILKETSAVLLDKNVVEAEKIHSIVISHPKIKFCHAIRSRGKADAIFIDFHIGVDSLMSVEEAHDKVNHEVKLLLKQHIPGIKSVLVHIEPDTADKRSNSIFLETDY
jgi:cation diffusion facilitator family transporter